MHQLVFLLFWIKVVKFWYLRAHSWQVVIIWMLWDASIWLCGRSNFSGFNWQILWLKFFYWLQVSRVICIFRIVMICQPKAIDPYFRNNYRFKTGVYKLNKSERLEFAFLKDFSNDVELIKGVSVMKINDFLIFKAKYLEYYTLWNQIV